MSGPIIPKAPKIHLIEIDYTYIISWLENRCNIDNIYGVCATTIIGVLLKTKIVGLTILVHIVKNLSYG